MLPDWRVSPWPRKKSPPFRNSSGRVLEHIEHLKSSTSRLSSRPRTPTPIFNVTREDMPGASFPAGGPGIAPRVANDLVLVPKVVE